MNTVQTSAPEYYDVVSQEPRIYVVNYIPGLVPEPIDGLTQIYAGDSAFSAPPGELTDRLAKGETLPNERWSELSAIYKVWQEGPKSEIVGFCHYRRFFNFGDQRYICNISTINRNELISIKHNLFDMDKVLSVKDGRSFIGMELHLQKPIFQWYSENHITSDYLDMFKLVAINHPEIAKYMAEHFSRTTMFGSNLFIFSWNDFDELCRFWFGMLTKFTALVSWPRSDKYQSLDVVFLAERMFDAWIRAKRASGHVIQELPVVFVGELRPKEWAKT